jgi:hypothetical protein
VKQCGQPPWACSSRLKELVGPKPEVHGPGFARPVGYPNPVHDCCATTMDSLAGDAEYPNGSKYSGQWRKGRWHGDGTLSHTAIGTLYEGQFVDGKKHGHGEQTFQSGQAYKGQWQCGTWHGRGAITGSHYSPFQYRGCFQNGRIDGSGMLVFKTVSDFIRCQ